MLNFDFIFEEMLFSLVFEIGFVVIGLLYVGDMYLDSVIELIRVSREIDEDEKDKNEDNERKELTRHLYA